MLTREQILLHSKLQYHHEQSTGKRSRDPLGPTLIDPNNSKRVEAVVNDIEVLNYRDGYRHLRACFFGDEAIKSILADIPRKQRLELAYLEALRVQVELATEGMPEVVVQEPNYEVKTLTFGNPPPETSTDSTVQKQEEEPAEKSGLIREEVADEDFEEISSEPAPSISVVTTPSAKSETAKTGSPCIEVSDEVQEVPFKPTMASPPATPPTAARIRKANLPDDVVLIGNAHHPTDKSGTILQSHLAKCVPDIKELPQYAAFDLFGELNGEMVDLSVYVNREKSTCYVGNTFKQSGAKCSVIWDVAVLGPLPVPPAKLSLRVISINRKEVAS